MKYTGFFLLLFLGTTCSYSQNIRYIDSLKTALSQSQEDTNRINIYTSLMWEYQWSFPDTALTYALTALELSQKLDFEKGEIRVLNRMGEALSQKGNYPKALETELKALELSEKINDSILIGYSMAFTGNVFFYSGDYQKALFYYNKQKLHNASFKSPWELVFGHLGETYFHLNEMDSAILYIQKAYDLSVTNKFLWTNPSFYLGAIYSRRSNYQLALQYYRSGVTISNAKLDIMEGYIGMSAVFEKMNLADSAIYYARQVVTLAQQTKLPSKLVESCTILVEIFKKRQLKDSAFKYMELIMSAKDSLFLQSKQNLSFNEQLHLQEIINQKRELQNKLKMNIFIGIVIAFLLIGLFLWRNNRQKQKAYVLLKKQQTETDHQKTKAESALANLKSTQAQLIQSEKMASLGELTTGIAHEIQNPLNFVNNFSEVNTELISEMQQEMDRGNYIDAKAISNDIRENEQKIMQHGKRADTIVKGMLQHSRSSSGVMEPTGINALADEYLRLAYHGLRAKDKAFNATIPIAIGTAFDESIGKINIVPEDIGRVLLNLYNNAFYTLAEKKKKQSGGYEPLLFVSTKKINGHVEVKVKDNGMGIPGEILDKIYQPFFTTKPTGQGTGLGLSLSYDIIKAHGGEIKVDTRVGEFAEFVIQLPITV